MHVKEFLHRITAEQVRASFPLFAHRAFPILNPGKQLVWGPLYDLACEHLELVASGAERRLLVNWPPRMLKSFLFSVAFPCWVWTLRPETNFLCASYSNELAIEFSTQRRNLITSAWYRRLIAEQWKLAGDRNRLDVFANTRSGQQIAVGIGGSVLGRGGDVLIADDVLSVDMTRSDAERKAANSWIYHTFASRLDDPAAGAIVSVSQRTHQQDTTGFLLEQSAPGAWTHVIAPLVAEADTEYVFPRSGKRWRRALGDVLFPTRYTPAVVDDWRRKPYEFASQMQQHPAPAGGAVIRDEWFQYYDALPDLARTVISLDTAFSTKQTADYSVATVWAITERGYCLVWLWRERAAFPRLKSVVRQLAEQYRPEAVLVENKASGQSLVQELKQDTLLPVVAREVSTDKLSRAHAVTALFSSGRVWFPRTASWLPTFLQELLMFPSAAHDDQVDSVTLALNYLRERGGTFDNIRAILAGNAYPDGQLAAHHRRPDLVTYGLMARSEKKSEPPEVIYV